mmetsp:Transcript_52980/g.110495  ORF Transcript_52980/g.110495 Transcript_52980/m.110495 type:complete len:280 (+) Transcript_52980:1857-2696(+)
MNLVLLLGLAAGEREDGELLVGGEHDEARAPHDPGALLAVVVHLEGRVVRRAVRDDAGLVPPPAGAGHVRDLDALGVVVGHRQQVLHLRAQLLLPQLLVGAEEVGAADDHLDGARLDVAHVDALRLVERNRPVPLHHLDLDGRHVLARAHHRPPVPGRARDVAGVGEGLGRPQEQGLVRPEHHHVEYAPADELLPGLEEEGPLPAAEVEPAHLRPALVVPRVPHRAVLVPRQRHDVQRRVHHLLVHVLDVGLAVLRREEPLLAGAALPAERVDEGAAGA